MKLHERSAMESLGEITIAMAQATLFNASRAGQYNLRQISHRIIGKRLRDLLSADDLSLS